MLLVLDVGNTNTVLGVFAKVAKVHAAPSDSATDPPKYELLVANWRVSTVQTQTVDEYGVLFRNLFAMDNLEVAGIHGIVISSVVPPLDSTLRQVCERYFHLKPLFIEPGVKTGMPVQYENPAEVGADRIVNAVAAFEKYGGPCVVVDFGTATTFDCITADGRFIGGVIMPGIRTASDELVRKTAKLPATELTPPERVIGRRTEDCIRAGVLWGTADAVDGMVRRIRAEWPNGARPCAIATGGLASLIVPLAREIESIHPDLTLTGLRLAAAALGLKW
jgi:type III pantothenate kinase